MSVTVLNTEDITSDVMKINEASGSIDTVQGILSETRRYEVSDDDAELNFIGGGLFFRNAWRGQRLVETDTDSKNIFEAVIDEVSLKREIRGFVTNITAKSPLTTLLEWPVEANDSTTHTGFTVSGPHPVGSTIIMLSGGSTIVPVRSQATFSDSLVPRFQIVEQVDDTSKSIEVTLDRGLESALSGGESIRFTVPEEKTGAQLLVDAFLAIDAVSEIDLASKIGSSFAAINTIDTAAGHLLWVHARIEDNFKLKDFLAQILEMCDLTITVSEDGIIDIIRGRAYQGNAILDRLTPSEIKADYEFKTEKGNLVIGYDCLYHTSGEVKNASGDVDDSLIIEYEGRDRWQPVKLQGSSANPFDYKLLYANATTADFFGEERLKYYGHARIRMTCSLKQHVSDFPLKRIIPQLGKEFSLTTKIGQNEYIVNEPVRVVGFQYDFQNLHYSRLTLELTNYPSENLSVDKTLPTKPELIDIAGIGNGFEASFAAFGGTLKCDVFHNDGETILLQNRTPNVSNFFACLSNTLMINGTTYQVQFWTESNGLKSARTIKYQFTAEEINMLLEGGDSLLLEDGSLLLLGDCEDA